MSDQERGVYGKYIIKKADGSRIGYEDCFFVLKLNDDEAARKAMLVYAQECGNEKLADDIRRCVEWLNNPPRCICGGGRDMDITCPFHDGGYFGHPVWNHGGDDTTDSQSYAKP